MEIRIPAPGRCGRSVRWNINNTQMNQREIKFRFRLKNFDDTITTHIYTLEQLMKGAIGYTEHILSQDEFTNLKDKNGKEIYEGDLISFSGSIWEMAWYVRDAAFTLLTTSSMGDDSYQASAGVPIRDFNFLDCGEAGYLRAEKRSEPIEVIGNIYENPDLLQAE